MGQRYHIHMVAGFVHEQQVWVSHQGSGKQGEILLATTQSIEPQPPLLGTKT